MQNTRETNAATELPVELTTFVGRERETAELCRLVPVTRLLTLTGAGGSGKTRLALQVARALADTSEEVAWTELGSLTNSAHIAPRIARAAGIGEEIREGDAGLLAGLLKDRSLILVLDNCEHLVDACAQLADVLLRTCPNLRIIATSREALGVRGERAWLVPPLPGTDAVALFVERAREFAGSFELTKERATVVAEICARLDGIPLAIELAAARIKLLSVEQLRDRLDNAFSLLKSTARTVVPRHRTLQAAIDWSFDLLSSEERLLFQRLAVFQGGFTLDALEAIASREPLESSSLIDLLGRLVDRSLVVVHEHAGSARYAMLETVLQYARLKLAQSGEGQFSARRHAEHFSALAAEAEPHLITPNRPVWVQRLGADIDNMRAALAWSYQHDGSLHVRLAGMLWWFWFSTRYWTEAGRVLADALTLPAAQPQSRERAKLLFAAGALAALQARSTTARPLLREAVAIAESIGDEQLLAYARNYLGMTYAGEARAESKELCGAAAEWFERNNDAYGHRLALLLLASLALGEGALDESARLSARAVEIAREFGQPRELAIALQTHSLPFTVRGDYDYARRCLFECLHANRQDPSYFSIAIALDCLAEIGGHQGRPLQAARLLGAAEHLRSVIGAVRFKLHDVRLAAALPSFRAATGAEAFERAFAEGRQLTAEQILDELLTSEAAALIPVSPSAPREVEQRTHSGLSVRALGPLEVEIDGELLPADAWNYAKPRELLLYLLLHPNGSPRDVIARALWPDATPAQLKNSFHVTLHHLRKVLGHSDWIVVEGERYRFAPTLTRVFDVELFEQAARSALRAAQAGQVDPTQLRAATSLYRGDLLQGEITGDWPEEFSSRLRRLFVESALVLGAAQESTGQVEQAAAVYEQIIAREELQEEAHRRLIALWTRLGDRPRALRHYNRLTALLRDVLDAEPERETVELYERILAAQNV